MKAVYICLLLLLIGANALINPSNDVKCQLPQPTPAVTTDPYCGCQLKACYFPHGWSTRQIWIDVVIVIDTSEAMNLSDLDWATILLEWIFANPDVNLVTDTKAEFYTRVGLIEVADEAKVLYNLNMTEDDTMKVRLGMRSTHGVSEMNFDVALEAAQTMLRDGQTPERAKARQVIYFMTDSEPKGPLVSADQFKADNGVIIVNNFLHPNETRPGLYSLASPGNYLITESDPDPDANEMLTLQLFCKANCHCRSDAGLTAYSEDPAESAAGGCLRAEPTNNQFVNARTNCDKLGGGKLVSIHDPQKGAFVQELMSRTSTKSDYFWIGYTRTDSVDGQHWDWEDKSINPYTNWADHQPGKSAYSKCAYVETATSLWGDGNCNIAYPSVCEFAPCEVGNKNC